MYPILYSPTETDFDSLGLGTLSDCVSAYVEEERNGKYELTIKYPSDGIHFEEIQHSSIIKVKAYDGGSLQLFRVYQITEPLDTICTINCEHVSYQLNFIPVMPFKAYGIQNTLYGLKYNAAETCPFEFWTDIQSAAAFELGSPGNIRNALGGKEGSVLDVYGGEFEWDNFTVKVHRQRGEDRDVTLRYGKNITDISQEENIASTYTGIMPYWMGDVIDDDAKAKLEQEIEDLERIIANLSDQIAAQERKVNNVKEKYDAAVAKYGKGSAQAKRKKTKLREEKEILGTMKGSKTGAEATLKVKQEELESVEGTKYQKVVYLSEKVLYADGADNFPYKRVRTLDLSDKFDYEPTEAEIRSMAQAWMDANDFGEPSVSIKVSFVPLWDTEEYKDIAPLERVRLCDIVAVEFERLKMNVAAKVTGYKYDVLMERYDSITLGEKKSFSQTISDQNQLNLDIIEQVPTSSTLQAEIDRATELIRGGYGGYVIFHANGDGQPDEILIMDAPNAADAVNVIRMTKNGIGFSTTGYEGPFRSAWTIDGHFVADFITSGTLNADVIRAGLIKDHNNTNYWNLDTGEFKLSLQTKIGNDTIGNTISSLEDDAAAAFGAAQSAQSTANGAVSSANSAAVAAANAYSKAQGIITDAKTGNLYISAACISAGAMSADYISGGTLDFSNITARNLTIEPTTASGSYKTTLKNGNIEFYYSNSEIGYIIASNAYQLSVHSNDDLYLYGKSTVTLDTASNGSINLGTGSGSVYSKTIRDASASSSATAIGVGSAGMLRPIGSSSRRYKRDIKAIEDEELDPHKILNIEVVQFKYNADYLAEDDQRQGVNVPGFIAEQVEDVYPIAANKNDDGTVEDWNHRFLMPAMLKLIQEQHEEIETLKSQITELREQMAMVLDKLGD